MAKSLVLTLLLRPQVALAKEAGLCYAALALVTDYDCWREEGDVSLSVLHSPPPVARNGVPFTITTPHRYHGRKLQFNNDVHHYLCRQKLWSPAKFSPPEPFVFVITTPPPCRAPPHSTDRFDILCPENTHTKVFTHFFLVFMRLVQKNRRNCTKNTQGNGLRGAAPNFCKNTLFVRCALKMCLPL